MRTTSDDSAGFDLIIESGRAARNYWRDLWRYRELFYFLAWRDLLIRYKQTVIGVAWAVIRPLLTMLIFSFVFGKVAKLSSGSVPYPILVFTALLPWQFFASAVTGAGDSLVQNSAMISKVYFPRLIMPTSSVIVAFADACISSVLLAILMLFYGIVPGWQILTLPFFVALAFAVTIGIGVWVAALHVRYRDIKFITPFVVQLGLYASPVGFSSAVVPEPWRLLYSLNPMVGIIDGFRWAILGGEGIPSLPTLALSIFVTIALIYTGMRYFRRTERTFADII